MIHFIDASSVIDAWHGYPLRKHPGLWACIERRIRARNFQTVDAIDVEIAAMPKCHAWLHARGMTVVPADDSIKAVAREISEWMGIKGGQYEDERWNDILLVATAKVLGGIVVTEEKRQSDDERRKGKDYRIPEICRGWGIPCTSLEELLRKSKTFPYIVR